MCKKCVKESNKTINPSRMFVDGKYIPKSHPLYKAGNYRSFNDAAFSSLENYKATKEGHVYLIYNPSWPAWIKVGMAVDAEDRLKSYQTGCPFRNYKMLTYVETKDRRVLERKAHKVFTKRCEERRGEWFKIPRDLAAELLHECN